jgi:cobalt-zinc-cadmium efflux system membrane fusion protein
MAACGNPPNDKETQDENKNKSVISFTDQQASFASIKTDTVLKIELAEKIQCKGTVKASAENKAKVSAPINGYVKSILVDYNDFVERGTPLVKLQHKSYIDIQKEYLMVKNKLEYAEKEYERQKTLKESNASAEKKFQKAEAEYKNLKAEKSALEQQLKLINLDPAKVNEDNISNTIWVYAPIKGFINEINISIGQFVTTEKEMFDMLNRENFLLKLQVFEKDIHQIGKGQKVRFSCSNPESKKQIHEAVVTSLGQQVNEKSKTFNVIAKPVTCYRNLRDGLFINAVIFTQTDSAWALPASSLIERRGKNYIFIAQGNNKYQMKEIDPGRNNNDFVVIKNYEQLLGKDIVVEGINYLEAELGDEASEE